MDEREPPDALVDFLRCRRPDGSVIWEFLDSYLLAAERGRWWIVGDVVHE